VLAAVGSMATVTVNRMTIADIPAMHHELRNSRGHLKELGWVATSLYRQFEAHFTNLIKNDKLWIYVIRVDNVLAGAIEVEPRKDSYFIGYWLGLRFRGKGIMTMCVKDVITHDLPDDKPYTARIVVGNEKSGAILHRLKFTETHTFENYTYFKKYGKYF